MGSRSGTFPWVWCNSLGGAWGQHVPRVLSAMLTPTPGLNQTNAGVGWGGRMPIVSVGNVSPPGRLTGRPPHTNTHTLVTVQWAGAMRAVGSSRVTCGSPVTSGRQLKEAGKKADWTASKAWCLRLYRRGHDLGLTFTIHRIQSPLTAVIGSNQVINPPAPASKPSTPCPTTAQPPETQLSSSALAVTLDPQANSL